MGELARLKAVTERVPGRNHGTYSKFATAYTLSVSLSLDSSPRVGAKGGCAAGFAWTYPLAKFAMQRFRCNRRAAQPPLGSPYGRAGTAQAVTERVPGRNHGTYTKICSCVRPLRLASLASSPHRGSQGAGVARPVVSPLGKQRRRNAPTMPLKLPPQKFIPLVGG